MDGLEKVVGLVVTCVIIVLGGTFVFAFAPGVMVGLGILLVCILAAPVAVWMGGLINGQPKKKQVKEEIKEQEIIQPISKEELLEKLSGVERDQVIRFGAYDWRVLDIQGNRALLFTEQMVGTKWLPEAELLGENACCEGISTTSS